VTLGVTGCATVKTYEEFSEREIAALEESQTRVNAYRQRLKEAASSGRPTKETGELNTLIEKELAFQGAIIRKDSKIGGFAKDLLHYSVQVAKATPLIIAGAGMVVLEGLAEGHTTVSP
jgi:hypothetical protein